MAFARFFQLVKRGTSRIRTGALIGTVGGVGLSVSQWSRLEAQCEDKRPTGLQNLNRALSKKHRVGLCDWPIKGCRELGDARVRTLDALFEHVVSSGYDGVELSVDMTRELYPEVFSNRSDWYVAQALRRSAERRGSRILGCLYLVVDGMDPIRPFDLDMADPDFLNALEAKLRADRLAGSEYCTFQVCLPKKYLNTGGSYRGDVNYYAKTAARMQAIQKVCHRLGLNCYFETHVDRISEDPVAFADILNVSDAIGPPVEVNGDLSHYLYRSITKGPAVEAVLMRLGHTHQRMAREHGDLSVDVVDPRADWETKGVTWKAFEFIAPALQKKGGLSSRVICGESGPIHLCTDPLSNDARLVPLFKAMARVADGEESWPLAKNPFGDAEEARVASAVEK